MPALLLLLALGVGGFAAWKLSGGGVPALDLGRLISSRGLSGTTDALTAARKAMGDPATALVKAWRAATGTSHLGHLGLLWIGVPYAWAGGWTTSSLQPGQGDPKQYGGLDCGGLANVVWKYGTGATRGAVSMTAEPYSTLISTDSRDSSGAVSKALAAGRMVIAEYPGHVAIVLDGIPGVGIVVIGASGAGSGPNCHANIPAARVQLSLAGGRSDFRGFRLVKA